MSVPSRLTGRQLAGHSVPFFESSSPTAIPEILASEVGIRRVPCVIKASTVKAIVPGQILGRISATNKYIPIKAGVVKTAIADTTSSTVIVLTGNVALAAGDVITIEKDSGTASKTVATAVYDSVGNDTTVTITVAIGAGALSVGARVNTSAATGGTAVAIASDYHEVTDYDQQEAMFTGGSFLVSKLTDYNADVLADFGGRISQSGREPGYLGDALDTVLTIL